MNASVFKNTAGTHLIYIKIAYKFLIYSYQELMQSNYNAVKKNENTIRDDLVRNAKKKKNNNFPFRWITEFPDIDEGNRIDIDLTTPYSLIDDSYAIKIECKIIGEGKYIDTKTTFTRNNSPTNGIMSFITGKYSSSMPLVGMIGFIQVGNIEDKIDRVKIRIANHNDIETLQNLLSYTICKNFQHCYYSRHKRTNNLKALDIYHLFFDFT